VLLNRAPRAIAALLAGTLVASAANGAAPADPVADCDRQAAHPEDPGRVTPGVERKDIDLPAATAACERAVAAAPSNARVRYQYARLLFYGEQNPRAVEEMRRAADAGYAQAQFVFGTFVARGRPGAPADVCVAEHYWRQSAAGGRQAARVQYLRYTLKGRFDACADRLPDAGLRTMLDTATQSAREFYERLVLEDLAEALAARARARARVTE
jgi:hypothetical protein